MNPKTAVKVIEMCPTKGTRFWCVRHNEADNLLTYFLSIAPHIKVTIYKKCLLGDK